MGQFLEATILTQNNTPNSLHKPIEISFPASRNTNAIIYESRIWLKLGILITRHEYNIFLSEITCMLWILELENFMAIQKNYST